MRMRPGSKPGRWGRRHWCRYLCGLDSMSKSCWGEESGGGGEWTASRLGIWVSGPAGGRHICSVLGLSEGSENQTSFPFFRSPQGSDMRDVTWTICLTRPLNTALSSKRGGIQQKTPNNRQRAKLRIYLESKACGIFKKIHQESNRIWWRFEL